MNSCPMPTSSAPFANPQLPPQPEGVSGSTIGGSTCTNADVFPMTSAFNPYTVMGYCPPCTDLPCSNIPCTTL